MAINVSLGLKTSLQQTLTPQQIQYLKLLQMPLVQFEQELQREIEENPLLVTGDDSEEFENEEASNELTPESSLEEIFVREPDEFDYLKPDVPIDYDDENTALLTDLPEELGFDTDDDLYFDDYKIKNELQLSNMPSTDFEDPFDFYSIVLQDDIEGITPNYNIDEDTESAEYQIKDSVNFLEELEKQLALYLNSEEEQHLGKHIIWNVDDDGYLRRDLQELVNETNVQISEINIERQKGSIEDNYNHKEELSKSNPAFNLSLDESSRKILGDILLENPEMIDDKRSSFVRDSYEVHKRFLIPVTLQQAEKVLAIIQKLDPPGIASRNIQECLIAQIKSVSNPTKAQSDALRVLTDAFDEFSKKHFKELMKRANLTEDELKDAIDVIKKLNPKPGEGISSSENNTVIPDFVIEKDFETLEPQIILNDSTLPPLKISHLYDSMKKDAKEQKYNKDTKQWIRSKYEDAKFIIQAVQQRKITMLKIMSAIAGMQKDFFIYGPEYIKPIVYKDIADHTGLDISTVCRIVNNKFVQTDFGTYELKYFFSEALPNDDGEEISTTVIKQKIKEMIEAEEKTKPLSDDQIAKDLKDEGFNIARRTVAKYREQLRIPVARLRKEL
jgi:RNA polymerase sigma-54 factor